MRSIFIFVAIVLIAFFAGLYTSPLWSSWFLLDRTFSSTSWWWSPLPLLNLLDEFVLLLLAGTVFGLLTSLRKPWIWGLVLGGTLSLLRLSLSQSWFSPEADLITYVWAYREYYLSPIGAVLGVLLGTRLRVRRVQSVVA